MANHRLGRGLRALLSDQKDEKVGKMELELGYLTQNPFQPRKEFKPEEIDKLANSLAANGMLQPIIVRKINDQRYEIIAGERRFRAAKNLGWEKVPVIIYSSDSDKSMLELALVENLQREDLNAMEKAKAFHQLYSQFNLNQEELGKIVGLDRSSIANYLRLLELPGQIQEGVTRGTISMGHARALVSLGNPELQLRIFHKILTEQLSVRAVERLTQNGGSLLRTTKKSKNPVPAWIGELESHLREHLSTKVIISRQKTGAGKMTFEFASDAELDRIAKKIRGN